MKPIIKKMGVVASLFCVLLCSCEWMKKRDGDNPDPAEIEAVVNEWIGKEILIDTNVGVLTTRGDASSNFVELPETDFKIIRYIGGDGCTSCRLHFHKYDNVLKALSDSAGTEVGFLCVVNPNDNNIDELMRILKLENLSNFPVLIDKTDSINRMNKFPSSSSLCTFLVDRNNRVLGVGDPAISPQIMRLYEELVVNDSVRRQNLPQTRLAMYPADMPVGKVVAGDSVVSEFHLMNIGDEPFILEALAPSCDCVTATIESDTIAPHEKTIMRVVFRENEAIGNFTRSVEVMGNIPPDFALKIFGTVVEK